MSLLSYLSGIFPDFFLGLGLGSSKPERVRAHVRKLGGKLSGFLSARPLLESDASPMLCPQPPDPG